MVLRRITLVLMAVIMACTAAVGTGAIKIIGSGNIVFRPQIESEIKAGSTLDENEAASRLYYLGMITGTGTDENGNIEFNINRGLTRIDAAVFAVRLFGEEEAALSKRYQHPFKDVPDWATGYVGVLFNRGLLLGIDGDEFSPESPETAERFISYCLFALGYRIKDGDYTYSSALDCARRTGICDADPGKPFTRGNAVTAIYNTLRTTMKRSSRLYSEYLVEKGVLSYNDAIFFLWSEDKNETDTYMSMVGYVNGWVIPDGYYTIRATEGGRTLNVAGSGYNSDYDGIGVTIWEETSDITQLFRLQRTERGTYYIYSAASRNGYGRVLGSSSWSDSVGLFVSTSQFASEFYIRSNNEGNWVISSAVPGNTGCLSVDDPYLNGSSVRMEEYGKSAMQTWTFENHGVTNYRGEELAVFIADSMFITQGPYDVYSHMEQNAVDMKPIEGCVKSPFDAKVVYIDESFSACNAVFIQSTDMVRYADGSYDYMTLCFLHDNDISDIYVGRALRQGEYFYDCGVYGNAGGEHVHVAVYRGEFNQFTMHIGDGDVRIEDALFVPDNTYIFDTYGISWNMISLAD